ncbi:MAG: tetratricopeptide repeat protein [Myxococcales bacterium FL481]|nr:MAG: tetratricopeptide repeat protein [Myxococcales bacterium FL481]
MELRTKHHLNVGREYYLAGDYERAEPHLLEVLKEHDGFADVHNMVGLIRFHRGQVEIARLSFERAVEINPHYTEAALSLAVCYNELGRYQDAKTVYASAAGKQTADASDVDKLDPFARGKLANLHFGVGEAYCAAGLLRRSVDEFRKALELCPGFVDIRTRLASTLRELGALDEALHELETVRSLRPDFIPARIHLGVTLWSAGRVDEARQEWTAVLNKDPGNRRCKLYLAMADAAG